MINNVSGVKEWSNIPLFSCSMNIHNWWHFLRNNPCVKMSIARRCDNAKIMVRWRDTDVAIGHRLTAKVLSHHCHCVIAPSPSHSCTIASSSSHHRAIVISHHCVIFPSTQTRWCDCTIFNCVALSGFHVFWLWIAPFTRLRRSPHCECDRSTEDTYSS